MTNEEKFKTVEERIKAFKKFCKEKYCEGCPCKEKTADYRTPVRCMLAWLELEYIEVKPLSCPFCGCSDIGVYAHSSLVQMKYAQCKGCDSQGAVRATVDEAIKAWNRRAK